MALLAGAAGLALATFGGGVGFLAGVLLASGAIWALAASKWGRGAPSPRSRIHG